MYFGTPGFIHLFINNQSFRDIVQNLIIVVHTTTAEKPSSNRLNEQHSGILGEIVEENLRRHQGSICMDQKCQNTLPSIHDYSFNQLIFGSNPYLPSFLNNILSAVKLLHAASSCSCMLPVHTVKLLNSASSEYRKT